MNLTPRPFHPREWGPRDHCKEDSLYVSREEKSIFLLPTFENRTIKISKLFNPLNPELNPICYLLALLGAHYFLHVSRIRVKLLTFRRQMSYIYIYIYDISSLSVKDHNRLLNMWHQDPCNKSSMCSPFITLHSDLYCNIQNLSDFE